MFKRCGKYLAFMVNDLRTLGEVSKWICEVIDRPYCIDPEVFSNMTIYHIGIKADESEDEGIIKSLKSFSEITRCEFIGEGED